MRYEVYVDVLFANCLITDYWILSLTGMILRRSATRRRKFLSAGCGACLTLVFLLVLRLPDAALLIAGYGLTQPLLLWLTYRVRRMREFACGCACMFFLAILYGGFFSFLQGKIGWFQEHALAAPVIAGVGAALYEVLCALVKRLQGHARVRQAEDSRRYEVCFRIDGFRIDCIAMLDTGNRLYEPIRGVPAAVLEGALYPEKERGLPKAVIPFHSLGCQNGLLYGYTAQDVRLTPVGGEAPARFMDTMLVALYDGRLSAAGSCQMLLHPDFFLETAWKETL